MTASTINSHEGHTWELGSADATLDLGQALGGALLGELVIGLVGPLGAGKTTLVKGIASGNALTNTESVTSPTFTLVHEYPGRLHLLHADVYRLSGPDMLFALGFDEWIRPDAAVVVEWADRVRPLIPDDSLWIELSPTGENSRRARCTASGGKSATCLSALRSSYR